MSSEQHRSTRSAEEASAMPLFTQELFLGTFDVGDMAATTATTASLMAASRATRGAEHEEEEEEEEEPRDTEEDARSGTSSSASSRPPNGAGRGGGAARRGGGGRGGPQGRASRGPAETVAARTSRLARERRKQEFDVLKRENDSLKTERDNMLARIEELQTTVIELREKKGDVEVELENDQLRAQLEDHKVFVQNLIRMGSGVPVIDLVEKRKMYRQGVDYAVSKVQALLASTARNASEWKRARVSEEILAMFPEGGAYAVWYQIVPDFSFASPGTDVRRINVRIDQIIPNCAACDVTETYWALWTNLEMARDLFSGTSHMNPSEVATSVVFHDEAKGHPFASGLGAMSAAAGIGDFARVAAAAAAASGNSTTSSFTNGLSLSDGRALSAASSNVHPGGQVMSMIEEESLATICTREKFQSTGQVMNNVFVASKSRVSIAKKHLYLPMEEAGSGTARGGYNEHKSPAEREECLLCARSSTRKDESSEIISSLYIEGSACWDLPLGENGGESQQGISTRRRQESSSSSSSSSVPPPKTACRLSFVMSFPDVMQFSYFNSFNDIIDGDGNVALPLAQLSSGFSRMVSERSAAIAELLSASSGGSFAELASSLAMGRGRGRDEGGSKRPRRQNE